MENSMSMRFIFKFAKNLSLGDYVVPTWAEPMCHGYWKCIEVNGDCVRFSCQSQTLVSDPNQVFIIRPDAPRHIQPELFAAYYGPGGTYHPWPYDYKNKSEWQLRAEIGEDMSADTFRKWQMDEYNKKMDLPKWERPELAIRKMHDRAVLKFYDGEDLVGEPGQVNGQDVNNEVRLIVSDTHKKSSSLQE
jgi:hypothetical protein